MEERKILFENLKEIKDYWRDILIDSLDEDADMIWTQCEEEYKRICKIILTEENKQDVKKVLDEIIVGIMHSIMVMIDGGDALTDKFHLDLINSETGMSLKEDCALNDEFIDFMEDED